MGLSLEVPTIIIFYSLLHLSVQVSSTDDPYCCDNVYYFFENVLIVNICLVFLCLVAVMLFIMAVAYKSEFSSAQQLLEGKWSDL